jgi:hypothetical protein
MLASSARQEEPTFDVIPKNRRTRHGRRPLLQNLGDPVVVQIEAVAPPLAAFGRRLQRGPCLTLCRASSGAVDHANDITLQVRAETGYDPEASFSEAVAETAVST